MFLITERLLSEQALQHSKRIGGLLLRNEKEEARLISEYATEMLAHEYTYALNMTIADLQLRE
jgi:hypothetical protein